MKDQQIFHGIHWNLKHIFTVTCISTAGEHMTSFMICSQVNNSVERLLKTQEFPFGVDLIIKKWNKSYMNS
jgi:macrodomain Ter protein organizer (MatP/YcbG family)